MWQDDRHRVEIVYFDKAKSLIWMCELWLFDGADDGLPDHLLSLCLASFRCSMAAAPSSPTSTPRRTLCTDPRVWLWPQTDTWSWRTRATTASKSTATCNDGGLDGEKREGRILYGARCQLLGITAWTLTAAYDDGRDRRRIEMSNHHATMEKQFNLEVLDKF